MEEVDGSNPSRSTKLLKHLLPKTLRELQQEAALQGEGTAPPGDSYGLRAPSCFTVAIFLAAAFFVAFFTVGRTAFGGVFLALPVVLGSTSAWAIPVVTASVPTTEPMALAAFSRIPPPVALSCPTAVFFLAMRPAYPNRRHGGSPHGRYGTKARGNARAPRAAERPVPSVDSLGCSELEGLQGITPHVLTRPNIRNHPQW